VASERPFDLRATPLDASLQQPLRDRLPAGRDAPAWRRWLTEAQMLLHEHPLAARASHPVDGLWFSQAGVLPSGADVAPPTVHVADVRAATVARGLAKLAGRAVQPLSTLDRALAEPADCLVVTMAADSIDAFDGVVANFIVPALDALDARRIDALAVVADGDGAAGTWWPERRRWRDRLRRRVAGFALPDAR
jgi:hypothetical protein